MKNITPEWEIVHMARVNRIGKAEPQYTVYLLHKGHAVSIQDYYQLWAVERNGPPYQGYTCSHDNTLIPEDIMERWIKMSKFLIPTT